MRITNDNDVEYPDQEGYEYIQGTGSISTLDTSARTSPKRNKKRKKKIPFGFQAPTTTKKS